MPSLTKAKPTLSQWHMVDNSNLPHKCLCVGCAKVIRPGFGRPCPRGHLFCTDCVTDRLKRKKTCPIDQTSLLEETFSDCPNATGLLDDQQVLCDNACFQRDLRDVDEEEEQQDQQEQERKQEREGEGKGMAKVGAAADVCTWQGRLCDLQRHLDTECPAVETECPNSCVDELGNRLRMKRGVLVQHIANRCPHGWIGCANGCIDEASGLILQIRRLDASRHLAECPSALVECPNRCCDDSGEVLWVRRGDKKRHIEEDCPEENVLCRFVASGCTAAVHRRDLQAHMATNAEQHQALVEEKHKQLASIASRLAGVEENLEAQQASQQRALERLAAQLLDMEIRLNARTEEIEHRLQLLEDNSAQARVPSGPRKGSLSLSTAFWKSSDRRVQDLERQIELQAKRHWTRLEKIGADMKAREMLHRNQLEQSLQVQKTPSRNLLHLNWALSAEHLRRGDGLCSHDFVVAGLGFELTLTEPSPEDGWRGFCIRVANRSGSGFMGVAMAYTLRTLLPNGMPLLDSMHCPEQVFSKRPSQANWGFRRLLQDGSQAFNRAIRCGGVTLHLSIRRGRGELSEPADDSFS